jgi:hypothetical protein
MTAKVDRSIPLAILGGAAFVAIAIYFGLRTHAPPPAATSAPTSSAPSRVEPPPPPVARSAVQAAVQRALEAQKPLFRERCWDPAAKAAPAPARSTYVFDLGIDAEGREVARGISETEGARPEVGQCLRLLVAPISIAPPRQRTTARVRIELP